MSYYFCIVGTRDNPIYQADLASKPAGSSGPASFFSSSSSSATKDSAANPGAAAASSHSAGAIGVSEGSATPTTNSTTGGVFGFGNALGAIAGGLTAAGREARSGPFNGGGSGAASSNGGTTTTTTTSAGHPSTTSNTASSGEGKGLGFGRYNDKHVLQMIAHSSLDVVEDKQFTNAAMYLKAVDRINEWTTSAFIAPGNLKFLILHEHKHDDGIRNFLYDVWEMVVKIMMNPFHDLNEPIHSTTFDAKVRASARKHL